MSVRWDGKTVPGGKYRGRPLQQVDTGYLKWVIKESAFSWHEGWLEAVDQELHRRKSEEEAFEADERRENERRSSQSKFWEYAEDQYSSGTRSWSGVDWGSTTRDAGRPGETGFPGYYTKTTRPTNDQREGAVHYQTADGQWHTAPPGTRPAEATNAGCAKCNRGVIKGSVIMMGSPVYCHCVLGELRKEADEAKKAAETNKRCTICTEGILPGSSIYLGIIKYCHCQLGKSRKISDQYATEAREWQMRYQEEKRRSQGRTSWDADPPATHIRSSITQANAKKLIAEFRRWAASKWHPDTYKAADAKDRLAMANAIIDWMEKCAENLRV